MFLARGGKLAGLIAVADPIKASSAEAITKLHALGLKTRDGDRRQCHHGEGRRLQRSASIRFAPI